MYSTIKRCFDIIFSLILLVGLSWLLLLIAVVYMLVGEMPIFFKQIRVGRNESAFILYKFRTLRTHGPSLEERRFWWGDFLRATSLDELPQLWNVLKGDMSFVGPRPLPVEYLALYSQEQKRRHQVRPGITGWAQVNGRTSIPWNEKFTLDLYYVQHLSFWLDSKIIFKTIVLLLSFRKDVSLNEPPFTGNTHA